MRNLFDNVGKLTWFLAGSAKRKEIFLETVVNEDQELLELLTTSDADNEGLEESVRAIQEGGRKKTVPKFCTTRWSARVSTLSALLAKYVSVLHAPDNVWMTSTGDVKIDAGSYTRLLQDSQFIASLTITQVILSFLGPVTRSLQAKDCNLADAYHDVALAKECISDVKK